MDYAVLIRVHYARRTIVTGAAAIASGKWKFFGGTGSASRGAADATHYKPDAQAKECGIQALQA
jgi:hypothetical protein